MRFGLKNAKRKYKNERQDSKPNSRFKAKREIGLG